MANTTNFGWETPDDTDLVKDGAAAMRTLGNSIDTSLVDLKGGTTGQVLSKASNTDLDFSWVAQDDSNAIQNAIVDAKGDLISASAADTPARLAVGTNGQYLSADSSTATGLKWVTPAAGTFFKNPVLNSNFSVWQRGTSISIAASTAVGNAYNADRWTLPTNANQACTVSRQATNDTTNLPNIQYCARVQRNSGQTGTGTLYFNQNMETVNSIPFAGKTITLSFYARAGANYSSASSALQAAVFSGTGTDQNAISGYTGVAYPINSAVTLTTTWQRFTLSGSVGATATELALLFSFTPVGTAGANDWFEITGIQLEVGSSATDYYPNGNTYQAELAACQRYYWRIGQNTDAYSAYTLGFASSTTNAFFVIPHPVNMRVKPTSIDYSSLLLQDGTNGLTPSAVALSQQNEKFSEITATVTGATQYRPYRLINNNSTSGYLGFNAEL